MNSVISYSKHNNKLIDSHRTESYEIESLTRNLTAYFLTTYKPTSSRTIQNDQNNAIKKILNHENQCTKSTETKIGSIKNIDNHSNKSSSTEYKQQYNKFKQTCINIEKTKNVLYKENILSLLNEKNIQDKENEILKVSLKAALHSIKRYENENLNYKKRLEFYNQILSIEKTKNAYNDLHYEVNNLYEEDHRFYKSNVINRSINIMKEDNDINNTIAFYQDDRLEDSMSKSSITIDETIKDNARDELLHKLQMEMEVLKLKLLSQENSDNDNYVSMNDETKIDDNKYLFELKDDIAKNSDASNENGSDSIVSSHSDFSQCKRDDYKLNEPEKQDTLNEVKERLEIEILACDVFHMLVIDLYFFNNYIDDLDACKDKKVIKRTDYLSTKPTIMSHVVDTNIKNYNEQLEIDLVTTKILSTNLIKAHSYYANKIIQLKQKHQLKEEQINDNYKEKLEIDRIHGEILIDLSYYHEKGEQWKKQQNEQKSVKQSSIVPSKKKLNLQNKSDLLLEIMEINLLIADIICALSSHNIQCFDSSFTPVIVMLDSNPTPKLCTQQDLVDNNKNIIIESKEIIEQELIEIDIILSEIFLSFALDIQKTMDEQEPVKNIVLPPLSHPIILDYVHTTARNKKKITIKKRRCNIDKIISDVSYSLALKSCENIYTIDEDDNDTMIDTNNNNNDSYFSKDVTISEQLVSYVLHCKENRSYEINYYDAIVSKHQDFSDENLFINILASDIYCLLHNDSQIDSYYVNKKAQEAFCDDNHDDYPHEQIFVESKKISSIFNSIFGWFRRAK